MMSVAEVKDWLATLSPESGVAIDDGGLSLVEVKEHTETGAYLEVGGVPDDDDEEVLGCPKCGHEWPAEEGPPCPACGC